METLSTIIASLYVFRKAIALMHVQLFPVRCLTAHRQQEWTGSDKDRVNLRKPRGVYETTCHLTTNSIAKKVRAAAVQSPVAKSAQHINDRVHQKCRTVQWYSTVPDRDICVSLKSEPIPPPARAVSKGPNQLAPPLALPNAGRHEPPTLYCLISRSAAGAGGRSSQLAARVAPPEEFLRRRILLL